MSKPPYKEGIAISKLPYKPDWHKRFMRYVEAPTGTKYFDVYMTAHILAKTYHERFDKMPSNEICSIIVAKAEKEHGIT